MKVYRALKPADRQVIDRLCRDFLRDVKEEDVDCVKGQSRRDPDCWMFPDSSYVIVAIQGFEMPC
jgi:hypothetical protein